MWDNLKPGAGPGSQPKLVPPQSLKERAFRGQTSQPQSQPQHHSRATSGRQNIDDGYGDDQAFWQNDFDNRLNGLGIRNAPLRYEVRRGKTVPQPGTSQQRQLAAQTCRRGLASFLSQRQRLQNVACLGWRSTDIDASRFEAGACELRDPEVGAAHRLPLMAQRSLSWLYVGLDSCAVVNSPPLDSDDTEAPPAHHPPPRNPRRLNPHDWRPTSSLYGDNEPKDHHHPPSAPSKSKTPARDMYGRPTAGDISPPSSPDINATLHGAYPDDVSPIDEDPDQSQQDLLYGIRNASLQEPRSHIPTMRRERRAEPDRPAGNLKQSRSKDMLRDQQSDAVQHPWEAVPGQIEGPHAGRAGFGLTTTVTGPQVSRSGNSAPTFGQRMRQLTRGKTDPVENRPPWNGASGRAPLVDPVRDDLSAAPLGLARRSSKRGGRAGGVSPESSNIAASTVRRLLPSRSNQKLKEASKTPSPEPRSHGAPSHAYPSPPYNDSPISQSHAPVPTSRPAPAAPRLAPNLPDPNKAIKRKPSPSTHVQSHHPHNSVSSSVYTAYTDQSVATYVPRLATAAPTSPFSAEDPWVPPPSRFSVTTCNTTTPDSPRHSIEEERPPMPTPPQQFHSVMDRRRPVPGGDSAKTPTDEPIVISIKSTLSSSKPGNTAASTDRPVSIVSTTKALPPAPPEVQSAGDRVAYLNARLDSLAHRRGNINKGIKQMTELMPTDNLMSSAEVLRKREIEKQKVEDLKEELAEIQREEYDLGLKLYRANKRLERESNFESSALWVRRATG
ncbi:hypothetical protein AK830_g7615 [Neonectria ditissima]|uniref:Uncharacterized protein n=1 Tax=Neonectria ditissima TaxID=78410 RepID=A0A0P7B9S9_9HYPO|nr:hypothetical protein AK830_g7615 [Neonectria ditissima]